MFHSHSDYFFQLQYIATTLIVLNFDFAVRIFPYLEKLCRVYIQFSFRQAAYSLDDEHLEPSNISSLRRHYLAQLMVDEGAVLKPDSRPNLPKQVSKSLIYFICFLCSVHFSFCLIKANSSLLFQSHLLSILTLLFSGLSFEGRAIQYYAEYVYQ